MVFEREAASLVLVQGPGVSAPPPPSTRERGTGWFSVIRLPDCCNG